MARPRLPAKGRREADAAPPRAGGVVESSLASPGRRMVPRLPGMPTPSREEAPESARARGSRVGIATAVALLATLAFLWPLPLHLGTHYPVWASDVAAPHNDQLFTTWILAWDVHALTHHPLAVFDAPNFAPFRRTLAFSENLIGMALLVVPVEVLWRDPVLTANVAIVLSLVVSAIGVFLLVDELTGSRLASALAAVLWTYAPSGWLSLAQIHLVLHLWTPFALLAWVRVLRTRSWRATAALAVLIALQLWTSLHWGWFLALGLTASTLVALAASRRARAALPQLAVAGAALLVAPLVYQYAMMAWEMDVSSRGAGAFLHNPLLALSAFDRPLARLHERLASGARVHMIAPLATWLAVVAGALAALVRRRPGGVEPWLVAALAAGGLTTYWYALGPFAAVVHLPDLYGALAAVPGLAVVRAAVRANHHAYLVLCILAGLGLGALFARVGPTARGATAVLVLGLLVVDTGWRGVPLAPAPPRHGPLEAEIARLPPGCAIAVLPSNLQTGPGALYRDMGDWHPIVNGYSGFYGIEPFFSYWFINQFPGPLGLRYLQDAGACAVVVRNDTIGIGEAAARAGLPRAERDGELLLPVPPAPAPAPATRLPRTGWRVVEPAGTGDVLLDGDLATTLRLPVDAGGDPSHVTIDLGRPTEVAGLDLALGHHLRWFLMSYRIDASLDGRRWGTLDAQPAALPPLASYRRDPRRIVQRIELSPVTVRFLRIGPYRVPPAQGFAVEAGFTHWGAAEVYALGREVRRSAIPPSAARAEPARMPTLAAVSWGSSRARPAMKSAIVKPMPASSPPPATAVQPTPSGRRASPPRTAPQPNSTIPSGLPSTRPSATAIATGEPRSRASNGTPALASAKTGITPKLTHGCSVDSRYSSGETSSRVARRSVWTRDVRSGRWMDARRRKRCAARSAKRSERSSPRYACAGVMRPRITPAMVACTPDCSNAIQISTPSTT
jgi:hypothetical protein